jgi:hypothetical protein
MANGSEVSEVSGLVTPEVEDDFIRLELEYPTPFLHRLAGMVAVEAVIVHETKAYPAAKVSRFLTLDGVDLHILDDHEDTLGGTQSVSYEVPLKQAALDVIKSDLSLLGKSEAEFYGQCARIAVKLARTEREFNESKGIIPALDGGLHGLSFTITNTGTQLDNMIHHVSGA